ncbi:MULTISPECIES: sugar ABC transporter ATP-binding protein [Vibrio]|uniref:Autoinducer 2 import ATP-binding protein LsrA n=1 Tax=Vibrio casei TaxID=673372 RepID=A0A368LKI4_9VIBR|nr:MULTISPECIES: sugar ABC transporter ATP-binding protein [Vibrio]RCS70863.1 sugar ABC transporter ATP-binding protein [Vibrio casei]SJN40461.1 Glycerol-3-phosphate ABC transporter, ATP-binding protein GlpS [Vibrio casei]HBV76641.1 sugar ABC transporter ATP-binding protein [Vibrio sp.]
MEILAIEARKIKKGFDGNPVLKDVNFTLKAGEVHALVGQNGAGKSTLVKLINGYHQRDGGEIKVFGKASQFSSPKQAQLEGISMVYQDLSLISSLSVADNIFLTEQSKKSVLISNRERMKQAQPFLDMLDVDISPSQKVETLSVGEQQFIEIAKALAMNAKILVLDEPTASLSNNEINDLFKVISTLKEKGISIIYITHYLSDIMRICDAVTVLRDGYTVLEIQTKDTTIDELVEAMLGNKTSTNLTWERQALTQPSHTPLLELQNISTAELDDVSLTVMPGQVVGLAGLLGSGRTEILEAIYGLTPLTKGTLLVNGKEVKISSPRHAIETGINMVPEDRRSQGLVLDFSVEDNVLMASFDRISRSMVLDKSKGQMMVENTIKKLGVKTTGASQSVRFLSGGNQQKVVIGKCLSTDAKILLLDDPTFGIDINAKYEIMKIVNQYVAQGNGVIFVSSEYAEVGSFCDVIYVVNKGRIVNHYSGQRMTEEELLAAVQ